MKNVWIAIICAGSAAAQDFQVMQLSPSVQFPQLQELRLFQGRASRDSAAYDAAVRDLDARKFEVAAQKFAAVAAAENSRADAALYWEAYALTRVGDRDKAMAVLDRLRTTFASSRWLNDAMALQAELKQSTGQPVSSADQSNEDIKLMAINSLMGADPERAIPLLEGLLKGNSAPRVKERALFVLTQNSSPRAQQLLADYAKGAGNPDLQLKAIRYIGMSGTAGAQQQLAGIYAASNDSSVKREIIRSLGMSKATEQIFNLAKNEKDDGLRREAIRQLGQMRATSQLAQLEAGSTPEVKTEIVRALFIAGAWDKLTEIAKDEKDLNVRLEAIRSLAQSVQVSVDSLTPLYASAADPRLKREIANALFMRGDAKDLIEIARKETDPTMKRHIVSQLSNMRRNKEATDYMMELLK